MTLHTVLVGGSVLLASMQLASNWLLKGRRRTGWALIGCMNVIGLPYDWYTAQYGYIGLTVLNFPVAVRAWQQWGRDTMLRARSATGDAHPDGTAPAPAAGAVPLKPGGAGLPAIDPQTLARMRARLGIETRRLP